MSGRDLKYCSDACLRRYLEARNWNLDKAKKMLEESVKWRSSYKPEEIRWVAAALAAKQVAFVVQTEQRGGLHFALAPAPTPAQAPAVTPHHGLAPVSPQ